MEKLTKKQYLDIYKNLPENIKHAITSERNSLNVLEICEQNDVIFEIQPKVAKVIGDVLFGLILPSELANTLETELGLEKPMAEKISQMANDLIIAPIKDDLEAFRNGETPIGEAEVSAEVEEADESLEKTEENILPNTEKQITPKAKKPITPQNLAKREVSKLPGKPITPQKPRILKEDSYKEIIE